MLASSGSVAARERGSEFDTRHPIMTEDMIRQLPTHRDGTGYAFILRNGLSPVIGRPPVIWRDRSVRRMTRQVRQLALLTAATAQPDRPALRAGTAGTPEAFPPSPAAAPPGPPAWSQADDVRPARRERRPWDQIGPGQ